MLVWGSRSLSSQLCIGVCFWKFHAGPSCMRSFWRYRSPCIDITLVFEGFMQASAICTRFVGFSALHGWSSESLSNMHVNTCMRIYSIDVNRFHEDTWPLRASWSLTQLCSCSLNACAFEMPRKPLELRPSDLNIVPAGVFFVCEGRICGLNLQPIWSLHQIYQHRYRAHTNIETANSPM